MDSRTNGGMPWVKLWTDFIHDDKLAELPRGTRLRFIELLALAGECDAGGALVNGEPMSLRRIAFRLHDSSEAVASDIEELEQAGLIERDGDTIVVRNWSKRQSGERWADRRAKTRERVAGHRSKQVGNALHAGVVTRYNPPCNSDVTPLDEEEEEEEDEEREEERAHARATATPPPEPNPPPTTSQHLPQPPVATATPVIPDEMRRQGAPPRKRKPSKDDSLTKHDDRRVQAYLEILRPQITASNARLICQRVSPEHEQTWRDTLVLWATNEWRATNFSGLFERFDTAVAGARARNLFGRPAAVAQDGTYRGKPGMIP